MSQRNHAFSTVSIPNAIRQEIQRFESVHPSIYAIYDLIEAIPDNDLQNQIREHVVCIEDSFVNSQEWTLSRSVTDLKLGVVGFVQSGKSALVHRYLTSSYMQEESPEGGRFKKEVEIDGQSYLLMIRDEGGAPEAQFAHWVDAVIFVFSLENEMSFNTVYSYYARMSHYRNAGEVPTILVGTQDAISESSPRVIDDARARKLAADLNRAAYYETCAMYGLNVERVFHEACQRIILQRHQSMMSSAFMNGSRGGMGGGSAGYVNPRSGISGVPYNPQAAPPLPRSDPVPSVPRSSSTSDSTTPVSMRSLTPPESQHGSLARDHTSSGGSQRYDKRSIQSHHHPFHQQQQQSSPLQLASLPSHHNNHQQQQQQQTTLQQQQLIPSLSVTVPAAGPTVQLPAGAQQQQHTLPSPASATSQLPLAQKAYAQSFSNPLPSERMVGHSGALDRQLSYNDAARYTPEESMDQMSPTAPDMTPMSRRKSKKLAPSTASVKKSHSFHGMLEKRRQSSSTPSSTPILSRKSATPKKPSNAVAVPSKREEDRKSDELGSGRAIPIKQGYLYKKGSKGLSKDWKKKYVTLTDDGKLVYHPNLHDYMDDVHGKQIKLMHSTVKIPGQPKPRTTPMTNGSVSSSGGEAVRGKENSMPRGEHFSLRQAGSDDSAVVSNTSLTSGVQNGTDGGTPVAGIQAKIDANTPHVKKRQHRRAKSSTKVPPDMAALAADGNDSDGYEFLIVSLDNKQWQFEAASVEDRAEWITAIERQILVSLQGNDSLKAKLCADPSAVQAMKNTSGNNICCDCGMPSPAWASLNLGTLICIECSGIHRNLGTHLSRVRSLDLDDWPPDLTAVMLAIGNNRANSVWEATAHKQRKPQSGSSREERESWIRAKYEQKEFLPRRSHQEIPLAQLLIESMLRQDLTQVILLLAHSTPDEVCRPLSSTDMRTPLHFAAKLASIVLLQLLLWYGADVKKVDHHGRTALKYAKDSGSSECIAILLSNGCPENPTLMRGAGGRRGSLLQSQSQQHAQRSAGEVLDKLPASVI